MDSYYNGYSVLFFFKWSLVENVIRILRMKTALYLVGDLSGKVYHFCIIYVSFIIELMRRVPHAQNKRDLIIYFYLRKVII